MDERDLTELNARLDAALEKAHAEGHPLSGTQMGMLISLMRTDIEKGR